MHQYVELHQTLAELVSHSAKTISPFVTSWIAPRTILDVGCGNGTWLNAFRQNGASEIVGLDGAYIRRDDLEIPDDCFRETDLSKPFDLGRKFDLVVSTEVAEHLPTEFSSDFIRCLTRHGDVVLFSAAIPGQGGVNHINEQWPSYWAELFRTFGYQPFDLIRPQIWMNKSIAYWYAQNLLLFVRSDKCGNYPNLPLTSENPFAMPLDIVHPFRLTQVMKALMYAESPSIQSSIFSMVSSLRRKFSQTILKKKM